MHRHAVVRELLDKRGRGLILAACVVTCLAAAAAQPSGWPDAGVPEGASVHSVATDMVLNGVPARVLRFELRGTTADALEFYRRRFGDRRVENTVQGAQVIGAMDNGHYHTVQIRPLGLDAVQGTVMTTSMRGGQRSAVGKDTERMLPAQTSVLSHLQSNDDGKRSVMVVAANGAAVPANRDHLVKAFQERGFRLVREEKAPLDGRPAVSLVLASQAEEAMVTIADVGSYRSVTIHRVKEAR